MSGFYFQDRPRSTDEAASQQPGGHEINIVKSAIQRYISKWLQDGTPQNSLLIGYAPRLGQFCTGARDALYFNTDFSWDIDQDSNDREVQVARLVESMGRRFPAILIIDGGYRNRTAGLGDVQAARSYDSRSMNFDVAVDMVVTLELMVISETEAVTNDLSVLLTTVVGPPLRRFGGGNLICSEDPNNHWQITLPLENSMSAISKESMGDDPQNRLYVASTSIEVMYDGVSALGREFAVRRGTGGLQTEGGHSITITADDTSGPDISFAVPESVRSGRPVYVPLILTDSAVEILLRPHWRLYVSDYRVFTYDPSTFTLYPKAPGTATLVIQNRNDKSTVLEQEITVTP